MTAKASSNVLVIDNYDSFTFNLVQYLLDLGADVVVRRNDAVSIRQIRRMRLSGILLSPGPGSPDGAGITLDVIHAFAGRLPLLGVCLGHQAIGAAFGAKVVRAKKVMHGKTCLVHHEGLGVFRGIESPFRATRYNSLILCRKSLPDEVRVTALTSTGEVMGIAHRSLPMEGVQFHPESVLSENGHMLLENWLHGLGPSDRGDPLVL